MSPELLLAYFDRVSEAPDAIPRLRRFILDLAVRGKLVLQDSNDIPASELLKRIEAEKKRCFKPSRNKNSDPQSSIAPGEYPFGIPASWIWIRFGLTNELIRGVTYSKSDASPDQQPGFLPILRANNIGISTNYDGLVYVKASRVSPDQLLKRGDYLLALSSGSKDLVGKASLIEADFCGGFGGFCGVVRVTDPSLRPFIGCFLASPYYRSALAKGSRGIGINNLKKETLTQLPYPLPPLAEQHRIVAKVDELMGLCDQLEAAREVRERRRDRLAAASLDHIGKPEEGESAFREHARVHFANLSKFTHRPDQIPTLRKTILDLAVRGKLVPQYPNDEPASELLKRIEGERAILVKEDQIRKQKPLSPIDSNLLPYEIRKSWMWVKIGDTALSTDYGTSQRSTKSSSGVPVLTMGNIQGGEVRLGGQKTVPATIGDLPSLYLRKFDLLYNRTNSAELVGKTGIFLGEDNQYTFASYLIRIRLSLESTNPSFFNIAMNAPYFRKTQIEPHLKQQCGQANVNGTILKNMLIPFPPIAEQNRIVAKVDELMALCDRLEVQLTSVQTESYRLLEALLHQALEPALEEVSA